MLLLLQPPPQTPVSPLQGLQSTAPPTQEGGSPWWNVAAHGLFRVVGGRHNRINLADYPTPTDLDAAGSDEPVPLMTHSVSFKPVAILLSNQPSDPEAKLVYTPAKSEGAYILAALALRQAAIQTAIWVGHVSAGRGIWEEEGGEWDAQMRLLEHSLWLRWRCARPLFRQLSGWDM